MADSIENLVIKDLEQERPMRGMPDPLPQAPSPSEKEAQEAQLESLTFVHKEEMKTWLKRKDRLKENLRMYSITMADYCTPLMVSRIEAHPDFKDSIKNNLVELLIQIKTLMHDPVWARYPFGSLTDSLIHILYVKPNEKEMVLEFIKRYKSQYDIVKSQLSEHCLDHFIQQTAEYRALDGHPNQAAKEQAMKDGTFEQWFTYLVLCNSDKGKFGSMLKGMQSQYLMKNDQYPRTTIEVADVLTKHPWDNGRKHWSRCQNNYNNCSPDNENQTNDEQYTNNDASRNHYDNNDSNATPYNETNTDVDKIPASGTATSFVQQGRVQCYCCGRWGTPVWSALALGGKNCDRDGFSQMVRAPSSSYNKMAVEPILLLIIMMKLVTTCPFGQAMEFNHPSDANKNCRSAPVIQLACGSGLMINENK